MLSRRGMSGPFMSLGKRPQERLPPPTVSPWQPHPAVLRFVSLRPTRDTVTAAPTATRQSFMPWRYR